MSDLIVVNSVGRVSELVVMVRRKIDTQGSDQAAVVDIGKNPSARGAILSARAAASAEEAHLAPRAVENMADPAPLFLPATVPTPLHDPATTPSQYPDYHYQLARKAYQTAARLDQRPQKLFSISI